MGSGFVYIFVNEAMPGLVKIGKTKRLPTERSLELFTTGVPQPFVVKFAIFVRDMARFEADIHDELSDCRVSSGREFFKIDADDAVVRILDLALSYLDFTIIHRDYSVDPSDLFRYRDLAECAPPDVVQVIDMFTPEEWKAAYKRLVDRRDSRKRKEAS